MGIRIRRALPLHKFKRACNHDVTRHHRLLDCGPLRRVHAVVQTERRLVGLQRKHRAKNVVGCQADRADGRIFLDQFDRDFPVVLHFEWLFDELGHIGSDPESVGHSPVDFAFKARPCLGERGDGLTFVLGNNFIADQLTDVRSDGDASEKTDGSNDGSDPRSIRLRKYIPRQVDAHRVLVRP